MLRQVGRYQIHDAIASGGMATVHVGRMVGPLGFSRTVAIKCLLPQFVQDSEFSVMLLDEARVCGRIHHSNVVQTLDVVAEGGDLLVVMEYVHGESLSRLVRTSRERGRSIEPAVAAALMVQVLRGLHAAHEVKDEAGRPLGLVHRDVSPQNVLVSADGVARVIDFGVAKALGRAQTTREGQIKGKLAYMSPEQLQGDDVDRATDVFAASIVLWELLTGARLFQGDDPKVTIGKILRCEVDPPSRTAPGLDPRVDEIVLRGLAPDPAKRYATAAEMASALESWAPPAPASRVAAWVDSLCHDALTTRLERIAEIERSGTSGAAPPPGRDASAETRASNTVSALSAAPARSSPKTNPWRSASIALALASTVAIGGLALRRPGPAASPAGTTASVGAAAAPPTSEAAAPASAAGSQPALDGEGGGAAQAAASPGVPTAPARRAPAARAPGAAPRKDDCAVPYVLDAEGHKHYKRECLQGP